MSNEPPALPCTCGCRYLQQFSSEGCCLSAALLLTACLRRLQLESKLFYLDLKSNSRGHYLKIAGRCPAPAGLPLQQGLDKVLLCCRVALPLEVMGITNSSTLKITPPNFIGALKAGGGRSSCCRAVQAGLGSSKAGSGRYPPWIVHASVA